MTQNLMSGCLKFDRPINLKKHYISLGGFSVYLRDLEESIEFDFENLEGSIDNEDLSLFHFELSGLDIDILSEEVDSLLTSLEVLKSFKEFFIYLGEGENEKIVPLYVKDLKISFNDGVNERDFSPSFCERVPLAFDFETPKYGIYDRQLGFQRDEEYESYQEALIDFGETLKERLIDEEEEAYVAAASQLSLHECLSIAGYEIITL